MPLVAHNKLPSFERLRQEGQTVLSQDKAGNQDIRELHVGLLNMMPDQALAATERQFFRLVGESNPIAQFYMHPFTLDSLPRGEAARSHIETYYDSFEQIKSSGLDALIITGANVIGAELPNQSFWEPLIDVINWAAGHVTSTLCSCLATHAVLEFRYQQKRAAHRPKRWGVFRHHITDATHPLVSDVNTEFDVPHSRWNDISYQQCKQANLRVLAASDDVGVHLATSPDGLSFVFFQGHPEYDTISLLKEYKREVGLYATNKIDTYPPFPANYFALQEQAMLNEHQQRIIQAMQTQSPIPAFPEKLLSTRLPNTWHDTAEAIVGNWIGLVYQVTSADRNLPFMAGINPENPLDLE